MCHTETIFRFQGLQYPRGIETWKQPKFVEFKPSIEKLAGCMAQYCIYVLKTKKMKQVHSSDVPVRQLSDSISVIQNTSCFPCFNEVSAALENLETYQHLCLSDFCPSEAQHRYRFLQKIKGG